MVPSICLIVPATRLDICVALQEWLPIPTPSYSWAVMRAIMEESSGPRITGLCLQKFHPIHYLAKANSHVQGLYLMTSIEIEIR